MAAEPADPVAAVPEDPADPVVEDRVDPVDPVEPEDGAADPEAVEALRAAAAVVQDPGSWEAAVKMIDPVL